MYDDDPVGSSFLGQATASGQLLLGHLGKVQVAQLEVIPGKRMAFDDWKAPSPYTYFLQFFKILKTPVFSRFSPELGPERPGIVFYALENPGVGEGPTS